MSRYPHISIGNTVKNRIILNTLFILSLLLLFHPGLTAKQWGAFTNTSYTSDVVITQDNIYTATWGGVAIYNYNPASDNLDDITLSKVITRADGLSANDIRTMAIEDSTGDIWVGTYDEGISIITSAGISIYNSTNYQMPDKIHKILIKNRNIYVATDNGIIQFSYLPSIYVPILKPEKYLDNIDVSDIVLTPNGFLYCATHTGVSFAHIDSLDISTAWHNWTSLNSPLLSYPVLSLSSNDNYIALNTKLSVHRHSINPSSNDWMTWRRIAGELPDTVFSVCLTPTSGIHVSFGSWDEGTMSILRTTGNISNYIDPNGVIMANAPEFTNTVNMPTVSIYRFYADENMLISTSWGQGLFMYSAGQSHRLDSNSIGFQTITEIATDKNNDVWITSGWIGASMTRKGTRGVSKYSAGTWENFNINNSPLTSDNIMSVAVDQNNRKWFGSWDASFDDTGWRPGVNVFNDTDDSWLWYTNSGIKEWSPDSGWGPVIPNSPQIYNNTIVEIYVDLHGNIMIVSSGGGITVFDKDYNYLGAFQLPNSLYQQARAIYHSGTRYFFCPNNDSRLLIWDDDSLPIDGGNHWRYSPVPDLNGNSYIYGVVTITNAFDEEENWIASSKGLFMWDGTDWYQYQTDVKRRRYTGVGDPPFEDDTLYYVDEERLFRSIREALPNTIFLDPFNRIWIGSKDHGISMYDPVSERFTNYYQGKSPLFSNQITCFGYDPIGGDLLIGTEDGLNTLFMGIQVKTETKLKNVYVYPNPFFPNRPAANGEKPPMVHIINQPSLSMPKGTNVCKIYDSSGALVIELKETIFARFEWNGRNKLNKPCSSGIYFYVVTDTTGGSKRGKIALIREE